MRDSLYLAWQYLRHHARTTLILIGSMTFIFFLPSALMLMVNDATEHFRSRARTTPLIVGARGSELELVLGAIYFSDPMPKVMLMSQLERVRQLELGRTIPLHIVTRLNNDTPIVGTSRDYYSLRDLRLAAGRPVEIAGECVVGSNAAKRLEVSVDSKLPVSKQKSFALAEAPLRLRVVGILSPTETPDDDVILVDLKTTWIVEGLGHGHAAGAKHGSAEAVEYTDITKDNANQFHFHGDQSQFPLSAVIIQPENAKARALLLGEFLSPEDVAQIVDPSEIMEGLLARIVQVRSYLIAAIVLVSLVTLVVIVLVLMLSLRLRQRELVTMKRMGCSQFAIAQLVTCQILLVLISSLGAAAIMTYGVSQFGHEVVRFFVV